MKKKYFLIIAIILMFSCKSTERPKLFNHYKTQPVSVGTKIKYLFSGITSYVSGSEIYLNDDSTFIYTTCGNIMTGTWKSEEDQVLLTTLTNKYRIDSLNKTWPKMGVGIKPMIFNIVGNSLTKSWKDGNFKTIEVLTKLK